MDESGVRDLRRQLGRVHLQVLTLLNNVRDMEDALVQILGNEHRRVTPLPFTTLPPPTIVTLGTDISTTAVPPSLCTPCASFDYTNLNGC